MSLLQEMTDYKHEQVVFCSDSRCGLKAIIAIHDTTLGPSLGGCRLWNYTHEHEAIFDVLRLSRGMTYKAAIAGLPLGGGKSVIIGDRKQIHSPELLYRFGEFVESLGGRYITAEDVNMKVEDIEMIATRTKHVTGISESTGGSGDPSPKTALGVFQGIRAAAKTKFDRDDLSGLKIAVQGCGAVGHHLVKLLIEAGCKVTVSDIREEVVANLKSLYDVQTTSTEEILFSDVDILAPCALGGILNAETIPQLKAQVVAGGANNQLLSEIEDSKRLEERGILYAPDYVINAGGLINVAHERKGYNEEQAVTDVKKIYETMIRLFAIADSKKITPFEASYQMAEQILHDARKNRK